ncbi:MAG: DNRLRE domain-containing protein [Phycisphaerae bacterium]
MTVSHYFRAAAASSLLAATIASAETISITSSRDNTLYEVLGGGDPLSNGAGQWMFVGETTSNGSRRGVIEFDVLGNLPAGSVVTAVSLKMHVSRTNAGTQNVGLQRLTSDWGEALSDAGEPGGNGVTPDIGDATWEHSFYPSTTWTTPGGDFSPIISAVRTVSGVGFYTWNTNAQLVADVQSWLDSPAQNFGWIMVGRENAGRTSKRFDTHENLDEGFRPSLTIEYIVPEPGSLTLLMLAGGAMLRRRSA